jgi:hypothetical protein
VRDMVSLVMGVKGSGEYGDASASKSVQWSPAGGMSVHLYHIRVTFREIRVA